MKFLTNFKPRPKGKGDESPVVNELLQEKNIVVGEPKEDDISSKRTLKKLGYKGLYQIDE